MSSRLSHCPPSGLEPSNENPGEVAAPAAAAAAAAGADAGAGDVTEDDDASFDASVDQSRSLFDATGRLVRDGFIMPAADFALLQALKARAAATGAVPDSSELLRAGLHALMQSGRSELRRLLDGLAPCGARRRRAARGLRPR